jgi:large conductance mechanosensitive channel
VRKTASDFKDFILRGNVVDLAVAVVVGAAFTNVVSSLVKNIFTPLLAIPGKSDFSDLKFSIRESTFFYGAFLNDLITFLSVSAVVFFFVVRPINSLMAMRKVKPADGPTTKECPHCLSDIPVKASRCAFCTSEVAVPA